MARTSPEIDWTHFGLIVIGNELNYQVLLPLQGLKSLSLTVFNKVFAQLRQMLSPKQVLKLHNSLKLPQTYGKNYHSADGK